MGVARTITVRNCDRCHSELPDKLNGRFELNQWKTWEHPHNGDEHTTQRMVAELCAKCGLEVHRFIENKE